MVEIWLDTARIELFNTNVNNCFGGLKVNLALAGSLLSPIPVL